MASEIGLDTRGDYVSPGVQKVKMSPYLCEPQVG